MGARVIHLAEIRASRSASSAGVGIHTITPETTEPFHFWSGASGRRYVHTVHSLMECPEVPNGNFLLVHRDARGRRTVLAIGTLVRDNGSLNLAELRHRGARLGANEVHVHLLAETAHERRLIELDIRAAQDGDASGHLVTGTRH